VSYRPVQRPNQPIMVTGSFPADKAAGAWYQPGHPLIAPRLPIDGALHMPPLSACTGMPWGDLYLLMIETEVHPIIVSRRLL
jgi:hypothetical protein